MKTNPNDLACGRGETEIEPGKYGVIGLTKREYFAALAMQGLLSAVYSSKEMLTEFTKAKYTKTSARSEYITGAEAISENAVSYADALIEELNKRSQSE